MNASDENDGFAQGVAWAIWLTSQHGSDAGIILKESGLAYTDFVDAAVDAGDLEAIRKVCRLEGIPLR